MTKPNVKYFMDIMDIFMDKFNKTKPDVPNTNKWDKFYLIFFFDYIIIMNKQIRDHF